MDCIFIATESRILSHYRPCKIPLIVTSTSADLPVAADRVNAVVPLADLPKVKPPETVPVREIGGRKDGLDPTRYGDWEKNGRCIDF